MQAPKYRGLIVDDEEPIRRLLARALSCEGIECDQAADGRQAFERYRSRRYDVVVTDLRMPNRHGHALCVDLLKASNRPLIVVLTGVIEPRLVRDLLARGVDDVEFKPVDFRAFAAKIKVLLEARPTLRRKNGAEPRPPADIAQQAASENHDSNNKSDTNSHSPVKRNDPAIEKPPQTSADPTAVQAASSGRDRVTTEVRPPTGGPARSDDQTARRTENVVLILSRHTKRAEQLPGLLQSETTTAVACENSEDLYRRLREQRVDLVILDHQLDGFLSGLDLLEKMHTDLLRPDAILIGELDGEDMKRVESLGVEVTFPPDVPIDDVVDAAHRLLETRNAADPLIPPQARKLVELYEDIPVLPQLLTQLLRYMEMPSEEIPLKKLADEISVDSRATAEILKLTNSATLGVGQKVVKVLDAVNLLGPKRTITLILSSATMHAQSELLKGWSEPLRIWYQHRSVIVASTASVFAKRLEKVSPNTAFTLGLLQDIGILVLANRGRERYLNSLLDRFRSIGHLDLATLEKQTYKLTHAEVSAAVLDRWKLPQALVKPVLFHHRDDEAEECDLTEQAFLRVMRVGEALADLLADVKHASRRMKLNRLLGHHGPKHAETCRECIEASLTKAREACQLFALPAPSEEELQQLLRRATAPEGSFDTIEPPEPEPHELTATVP
ncbi:MAG: HDOD domain-containing protein [Planctomycetes bacterium]|nr:HDOD domain-containing protein [Planctomycetota bacterium]